MTHRLRYGPLIQVDLWHAVLGVPLKIFLSYRIQRLHPVTEGAREMVPTSALRRLAHVHACALREAALLVLGGVRDVARLIHDCGRCCCSVVSGDRKRETAEPDEKRVVELYPCRDKGTAKGWVSKLKSPSYIRVIFSSRIFLLHLLRVTI